MPENNNNLNSLEQSMAIIQLCKDLLENKKRDTKLLFLALVVSLVMNILIVASFLIYESQWEYTDTTTTTTEQTVDGEGNIVNGNQYNDQAQNNSGGGD